MAKSVTVSIFTDGGARGNPGIASWAFAVYVSGKYKGQKSAAVKFATNNQMELQALIEAMRWVEAKLPNTPVTVYTDSSYVQQGYLQWLGNWVKRNWRTAGSQPVKNKEQWKQVHAIKLKAKGLIEVKKVKGHSGLEGNEKADKLCNERMDEMEQKLLEQEAI